MTIISTARSTRQCFALSRACLREGGMAVKKTLCLLLALACVTPVRALAAQPEISAQAYIVTDAESGRVLYGRNTDEHMLIASVTKLVTALVVAERCELTEKVTVPREAANVEGSSMYLKEGEQLTVLELLYGMLLESGNDAAAALAYHVSGSIEGFAELMNEKAKQLGANDSSFKNPHGLDAPDHYSCARDMAIIAAEVLKNKTLADICATLSASAGGRTLTNHNKLLTLYPGVTGLKTGYTKNAGRTLVSCAEKNGLRLICVTLNAPDDWNDHAALYDRAFSEFTRAAVCAAGEKCASVPVLSGTVEAAGVCALQSCGVTVAAGEKVEVECSLPDFVYAPVKKGEMAGEYRVKLNGENVCTVPLVFAQDVPLDESVKLTFWEKLKRAWYISNKISARYGIYAVYG